MLAQTQHEIRGYKRTAQANALQGVSTEFISPEKVKSLVPIIILMVHDIQFSEHLAVSWWDGKT